MSDQNRPSQIMPISGVLALLAVLGVVIFKPAALKGDRPLINETYELSNKARARLWQDPFRAVLDHEEARKKQDGVTTHFPNANSFGYKQLAKEKDADTKLTILGVMVFGGPYAEDSEWRMRTRYAVLSALAKAGYIPDDENHVGFVRFVPPGSEGSGNSLTLSNIIPFEWLREKTSETDDKHIDHKILVLWINDDAFQKSPLTKIVNLIFNNVLKDPDIAEIKNAEIKIIGPAGSTNLVGMMNELQRDGKPQRSSNRRQNLEIYSGVATADVTKLTEVKISDKNGQPSIYDFKGHSVTIERTIKTDFDLAKVMVEELCLRDINSDQPECTRATSTKVHDHKDHIVLVSEWDTFYGRSLPLAFENAFGAGNPGSRQWIHRYSYMRGIDGVVPGDKPQQTGSDGEKNGKSSPRNDADHIEQPTGESQLDYIRRLGERMKHLDDKLKKDGTDGVRVVGILGSDFYDKYLVLQALRQRFPDIIFFTTDMDARLLHPENIRWTRNVLVGSHYNLLKREMQGEIPPFRDTYQTSVFFTTLYLLNRNEYKDVLSQQKPHVYEIGRKKAYLLSRSQKAENVYALSQYSLFSSRGLIWKFPLFLLSVFILASKSSYTIRAGMIDFGRCIKKRPQTFTTTASAIVLFAAWFYSAIVKNNCEEPVLLDSGISIWPTEIVRMIAAICAVALMIRGLNRLADNFSALAGEFELPAPPAATTEKMRISPTLSPWSFRKMIRSIYKNSLYRLDRADKSYKGNIAKLWQRYVSRGATRGRHLRTALYVLVYVAFGAAFMAMSGLPHNPIRGANSFALDKIILFLSVFSYLFLTFFVVDATRLCKIFIKTVSKKTPQWSDKSIESFLLLEERSNEHRKQNIYGDLSKQLKPMDPGTKDALSECMLMRLIAKRTAAVANLVFYPFIVLFVLIVSRANFFDNWTTPLDLAVIISLTALYAWSCASVLRRSAERARNDILDRLSRLLTKITATMLKNIEQEGYVKRVIEEVKEEQRGAFAPFTQQPAVQALLVPFGGFGSVAALNFLEKLNL